MIECRINGVPYALQFPFSISEKAGNNTSSTILVEVADGQRIPVAGDLIELQEDGGTLFLGTCGIPTSPKFKSPLTPRIYKIVCGNGNSLLRRRIVNYGTQNKTITEIVEYLYSTYIQAEGISKGIVSAIPITLNAYTAADMGLQDVLNELADYVSGAWQVTNDRVFHFIAKDDFDHFPATVTGSTFLGAEIQTQTKDQDTRTSQTVKGLMAITDTQTESFSFDGVKDVFDTAFPIVQKPTQIKRGDGIILPQDRIGVKGIDDQSPNMVFLFAFNSRELTYRKTSSWLAAGQSFSVSYVGQFPIRVHSYNIQKIAEISAQTGTSGLIDHVHEDNTLTTIEDAQRLADSLISNYGDARREVSFWLRSSHLDAADLTLDDFRLMRQFTFAMPEIGLSGDFVVTERTLESMSAAMPFEDGLRIRLKLVDRGFVRSYGQTLKVLVKQQQRNIREDVIVVTQQELEDTPRIWEALEWSYGHPVFWPVASTATANDPFDGLAIYPA